MLCSEAICAAEHLAADADGAGRPSYRACRRRPCPRGRSGEKSSSHFLLRILIVAFRREELPVAAVARRHHAVEHIHAPLDAFEDIHRRADPHQVAGTVFGQYGVDHLDHLVHHLGRFAYGQSADGIAVGVVLLDVFGCPRPQVGIGAALYDGEQRLVMAVFGLGLAVTVETTVEPALGQSERLGGIIARRVARRALVEGHHDVGADRTLGVDHAFGREEVASNRRCATGNGIPPP